MAVDPKQVLLSNDIVPENYSGAERKLVDRAHRDDKGGYILRFDPAHQLERNSEGYVYVIRPGSPNQKFYSFIYE